MPVLSDDLLYVMLSCGHGIQGQETKKLCFIYVLLWFLYTFFKHILCLNHAPEVFHCFCIY